MRQESGELLRRIGAGGSLLGVLVWVAFSVGCSNSKFSQTHYVGVVDEKTGSWQLYRFEMEGDPGWTNTQFVSGWYDQDGLNKFLGENTLEIGDAGKRESTFLVAGPEGSTHAVEGKQLAIIMKSDPKPITQAIRALAQEAALKKGLGKLLADKSKAKDETFGKMLEVLTKLNLPPEAKIVLEGFQAVLGDGNKEASNDDG